MFFFFFTYFFCPPFLHCPFLFSPSGLIQAHSDLIVCMRLSPDCSAIATAGSGGEVKLWNTNWELVAKAVTPVESLFHVRNLRYLIGSVMRQANLAWFPW